MKTALLTSALLAFTGAASAQPQSPEGEIYAAHGTEPFWGLTFEDGKMVYSTPDEERIEVARPQPVTRGGVHIYRTPRMTVEISHEGRCDDGMSDYEYPDTVRVRFGNGTRARALEGCGGGILPPVTLIDTNWAIADIDGVQVGGTAYALQFDHDGLSGRAGCNRFAGPYTQTGRMLVPGAIRSTREGCGSVESEHQAKMMRLLSGPVQIRYRSGVIMTLSGERDGTNIYVTLRRM